LNLRKDTYRLPDEILKTGTPLELDRNGHQLLIVALDVPGLMSNLLRRPDVVEDRGR
jgi:hypothetical protein